MIKKILLSLLLLPLFLQAQSTISGTFSPAENYEWFIIYKLNPTLQTYIGNGKIIGGKMTYTFSPSAEKGMYRFVYGLPQETKNFDFIFSGNEDIQFTFEDESVAYVSSKENILYTSHNAEMQEARRVINLFYQNGNTDTEAFLSIFNGVDKRQQEFEKEAEGTRAYHFIKASRIYIPTRFETPAELVENIKIHYFDFIDFANPVLQDSEFLSNEIVSYVFTAITPKDYSGDELEREYQKNITTVAEKIKSLSKAYQKALLTNLWEQMVAAEGQNLANYLDDTYLRALATAENDQELINRLDTYKRLSYGAIAPEITWVKDNKTHKLSELNTAENYILVFWSSTCSHCLKELPLLKEFTTAQEKGTLQVIAIGLEEDRYNWANEILSYPSFIHVLGLEKWENELGRTYNVTSTPTFFVLDKNKRIIGKPDDVQELKKLYTGE